MKILQIHSPYRIAAGEDTVVANEARLLRSGGHEVWQFFEPNPSNAAPALVSTVASPWNPMSARQLRHRLRADRPDIVHVHNTWFRMSPSIFPVLADADLPVVRTLHNYRTFCIEGMGYREGRACTDCLDGSPTLGIRHACFRSSTPLSVVATAAQLVQRAVRTDTSIDLFLAPSEFMRSIIVRSGIPADRTVVKAHFTLDPGRRTASPSASRTVMAVGRVASGKGIDVLLDAWRLLPDSSELELEVIGSGPLVGELEANAPAGVRFMTMSQPEVIQRMLSARALIFPSMLNETFGMVLIEAMSAGLAVVGFDAAATGEILGEHAEPPLAPLGDVRALADRLLLLEDDSLVDRAGDHNLDTFRQQFSPEAQLPLLEGSYEDAVGRHGRR